MSNVVKHHDVLSFTEISALIPDLGRCYWTPLGGLRFMHCTCHDLYFPYLIHGFIHVWCVLRIGSQPVSYNVMCCSCQFMLYSKRTKRGLWRKTVFLIQVQPQPCSASPLPQPKNTGYNLRQRTHDLTLPTDINAVTKQNFVYRMLFRDIY